MSGEHILIVVGVKLHVQTNLLQVVQALGSLRASLGVFAILGNHDHWTNAGLVTSALEANSIPVLRNAALPIERGTLVP